MGARYILALVLMIVVMVAWSLFYGNRFAPEPDESATTEQTPATAETDEATIDPTTQATTADGTTAPLSPDLFKQVQESPDDSMVNVQTDNYTIVFNENSESRSSGDSTGFLTDQTRKAYL